MNKQTMDEEFFFFEIYDYLPQCGPGSDVSTRQALRQILGLPPQPTIVDFGCGSGRTSLLLAKETQGQVVAIDTHKPFIATLSARVSAEGLDANVLAVVSDMGKPPLALSSADLIWSEGAIYFLGFAQGLKQWKNFLKTGGYVAVTEATWLTDHPSGPAMQFWQAEYPAMQTIATNLEALKGAGYEPLHTFTLPADDWLIHFYQPLQARLAVLRATYPNQSLAQKVINDAQAEIDLYQACSHEYGYVFYVAQKH